MNNKVKFWLFIYPHVFIFIKKEKTLLYNAKTSDYLFCETISELVELCKPENMYSILINGFSLHEKNTINQIIDRKFGELIPFDVNKVKPISLFPQCVIEKKINNVFELADIDSYITELSEITIMLTGKCTHNCSICAYSYKQRIWCHKSESELSFIRLKKFLGFLASSGVVLINLVGGDIFSYPYLNDLFSFIKQFNVRIKIIIHYAHLNGKLNRLASLLESDFDIELLIDTEIGKAFFVEIINGLKRYNTNIVASVRSISDYESLANMLIENNIESEFVPVYDSNNHSFFNDYVLVDTEEILKSSITLKEIFAHQLINTNNYGRITISSNGEIYANVNKSNIGSIDDNIFKIIHSQLLPGSEWRTIRENNKCTDCLLQWLCPSPSNYETVLDRNSLCRSVTNDFFIKK